MRWSHEVSYTAKQLVTVLAEVEKEHRLASFFIPEQLGAFSELVRSSEKRIKPKE